MNNVLYSIYQTSQNWVIEPGQRLVQNTSEYTQKMAKKHLTLSSLKNKTSNAIKSKIFPLSVPADLKRDMVSNAKKISRLKTLQTLANQELKDIELKVNATTRPSRALLESRKIKQSQYEGIRKKLEEESLLKEHLINRYYSIASARLGWYVDKMVNLMIPGAPVGMLFNATTVYAQESSAQTLPSDCEQAVKARGSVRTYTLLTAASTLTTMTIGYFALPSLKAALVAANELFA